MSQPPLRRSGKLATAIGDTLRQDILSGRYAPGDKLPSEAQLTEAHGVSRTVVREALAHLRRDGLVEAHQGLGVFVLDRARAMPAERARLTSSLEILELRIALEVAAAGLAALRRSPVQEERILARHAAMLGLMEQGGDAFRAADFALHVAIAEATSNAQFSDFMARIGEAMVPQSYFTPASDEEARRSYRALLMDEHEAIVRAICASDRSAAEEAMRRHLIGSQSRHRDILQSHSLSPAGTDLRA
ncbi:FadR/GntR family transcriptional regulator [Pseudoroseicyclus aestuarii]|uniref:GntR family transcriptional regulator n=1 Tax=Pseudoroseicyclus aestuarii TaxID=1795041 RepID=A0A318T2M5_9RHOB|nr:FadR/GntR family transcriptional regulator [Pseudoroseicyclus aestuarii]PYE86257.1 GntR family transcriptional regulator [Pseudoroseicyclus aestuarii]